MLTINFFLFCSQLAPAPKTLVEGDQLPAVFGLNFDFHPQLKEHRNLSEQLPSNLPLKHIASEQNYQADPTTQVGSFLYHSAYHYLPYMYTRH